MISNCKKECGDLEFISDTFFVEEVLDQNEVDDVTMEMRAWESDSQHREKLNASMPGALAAAKLINSDPRMFYGKPIVSSPSINVPNKHFGYVLTWFSLAGFLLLSIFLGKKKSSMKKTSWKDLRK
jgi:cytochrome oxidase assembly protein ShyY1